MIFPFGPIIVDEKADPNALYMVGMRYKPIVLALKKSINSLSPKELVERGIDWEATGKASAVIFNIGEEKK